MVQQVVNTPPVDPPPAEVVVETMTFAQTVQASVLAFSTQMSALKTARGSVNEASESKVAAQTQLTSAEEGHTTAMESAADAAKLALTARDDLVTVLQSWVP